MAIVEQITGIFDAVAQWFGDAMGSVEAIFWNATSSTLTTIGTLAIMGLAVSLAMLLINVVKDFLRFR